MAQAGGQGKDSRRPRHGRNEGRKGRVLQPMAYERDDTRRTVPERPLAAPQPTPDPAPGRRERAAYPAEEAGQGDVVLRKTWQRGVFLIGLFAGALVAIALIAWAAFL